MFSIRENIVREKRLGPRLFGNLLGQRRTSTVTEEGALFLANQLKESESGTTRRWSRKRRMFGL